MSGKVKFEWLRRTSQSEKYAVINVVRIRSCLIMSILLPYVLAAMWVMMSKARPPSIKYLRENHDANPVSGARVCAGGVALGEVDGYLGPEKFVVYDLCYAQRELERDLGLFGSRFGYPRFKAKSTAIVYIRQHEPPYEGFPGDFPYPRYEAVRTLLTAHDQELEFEVQPPASLYLGSSKFPRFSATPPTRVASINSLIAFLPSSSYPPIPFQPHRPPNHRTRTHDNGDNPAALKGGRSSRSEEREGGGEAPPLRMHVLTPPLLFLPSLLNSFSPLPVTLVRPRPLVLSSARSLYRLPYHRLGSGVPVFHSPPSSIIDPDAQQDRMSAARRGRRAYSTDYAQVRYNTTTTATRKGEPAYHLRLFPMQPSDATAYELGADEAYAAEERPEHYTAKVDLAGRRVVRGTEPGRWVRHAPWPHGPQSPRAFERRDGEESGAINDTTGSSEVHRYCSRRLDGTAIMCPSMHLLRYAMRAGCGVSRHAWSRGIPMRTTRTQPRDELVVRGMERVRNDTARPNGDGGDAEWDGEWSLGVGVGRVGRRNKSTRATTTRDDEGGTLHGVTDTLHGHLNNELGSDTTPTRALDRHESRHTTAQRHKGPWCTMRVRRRPGRGGWRRRRGVGTATIGTDGITDEWWAAELFAANVTWVFVDSLQQTTGDTSDVLGTSVASSVPACTYLSLSPSTRTSPDLKLDVSLLNLRPCKALTSYRPSDYRNTFLSRGHGGWGKYDTAHPKRPQRVPENKLCRSAARRTSIRCYFIIHAQHHDLHLKAIVPPLPVQRQQDPRSPDLDSCDPIFRKNLCRLKAILVLRTISVVSNPVALTDPVLRNSIRRLGSISGRSAYFDSFSLRQLTRSLPPPARDAQFAKSCHVAPSNHDSRSYARLRSPGVCLQPRYRQSNRERPPGARYVARRISGGIVIQGLGWSTDWLGRCEMSMPDDPFSARNSVASARTQPPSPRPNLDDPGFRHHRHVNIRTNHSSTYTFEVPSANPQRGTNLGVLNVPDTCARLTSPALLINSAVLGRSLAFFSLSRTTHRVCFDCAKTHIVDLRTPIGSEFWTSKPAVVYKGSYLVKPRLGTEPVKSRRRPEIELCAISGVSV
ncbi:hypothetical protein DFP72DRAFT_844554 [Ephemerocybe angulata]|uniref:Uncharacterized protein n=1 Tax=Ephemerocybe angulata TaxID=980116 RepID=A0A8H6I7G4_9AGAR|nr:hypothetical protein DFP72DRAFT_844554 [Tulosesus angulatus]